MRAGSLRVMQGGMDQVGRAFINKQREATGVRSTSLLMQCIRDIIKHFHVETHGNAA
jgi:hypothetical protein